MVSSPSKKRRLNRPTAQNSKSYAGDYVVREVLGYKLKKSQLLFYIAWEGYGDKDNSWEPVEFLNQCIPFQEFVNEKFRSLEKEIYIHVANVKQTLKKRIRDTMLQPKGITMLQIQPFDPFEYKVRLTFFHLVENDEKFTANLKEEIFKNHFFTLDMFQRIRNDELLDRILKKEDIAVTIENEEDFDDPPKVNYITTKLLADDVYIVERSAVSGCKCRSCDKGSNCCPKLIKETFAYKKNNKDKTILRLNTHEKIFECGDLCLCGPDCMNRVTQQKKQYPLCLFKTKNRGWGVKAMINIPKGAFIIEYVGELMGQVEANSRAETSYLFDCNPDSVTNDQYYTIDAFFYGNLARFINNSCDPNTKIWFVNTCQGDPKNIKLW
jgi:[histone H3]-lysine9 N-trimethyltransferase SUV39H